LLTLQEFQAFWGFEALFFYLFLSPCVCLLFPMPPHISHDMARDIATRERTMSFSDDLLEGAVQIGDFLFGQDPSPAAKLARQRRVYRLTTVVAP